ncbi:hypothetical protein AVEN_112677-1, partial [Araneus ventricosus]
MDMGLHEQTSTLEHRLYPDYVSKSDPSWKKKLPLPQGVGLLTVAPQK